MVDEHCPCSSTNADDGLAFIRWVAANKAHDAPRKGLDRAGGAKKGFLDGFRLGSIRSFWLWVSNDY